MERQASASVDGERAPEPGSDAGFEPLGLDVFVAEMAFNYQTVDGVPARLDYNGLTGTFIRVYPGVRTGIFPVNSTGLWSGGWSGGRSGPVARANGTRRLHSLTARTDKAGC